MQIRRLSRRLIVGRATDPPFSEDPVPHFLSIAHLPLWDISSRGPLIGLGLYKPMARGCIIGDFYFSTVQALVSHSFNRNYDSKRQPCPRQ